MSPGGKSCYMLDRFHHRGEIVTSEPITPRIHVNTPDFMMYFESIEAGLSVDHNEKVWIHILSLEDDDLERAHFILPLLLLIDEFK